MNTVIDSWRDLMQEQMHPWQQWQAHLWRSIEVMNHAQFHMVEQYMHFCMSCMRGGEVDSLDDAHHWASVCNQNWCELQKTWIEQIHEPQQLWRDWREEVEALL
ncbi:hypothetical protein BFW38_09940 [Terasakiispira papahanaumokuakeensis]|uniref:Uncharacterized protein n=1 Tax=Terasakiispira papahanaumokuakeensis TaxID=197479 RepID=A0A1E2VAY8_9GAMM|nr:hypothetical protein [Terasakiispira papahanaumokuakeensis]ODC03815.1 hypothetical protein BFW38_09940 [Terasakiispira papahanaumokuakeensis]